MENRFFSVSSLNFGLVWRAFFHVNLFKADLKSVAVTVTAFAFDFTWRRHSVNCDSHVSEDINHVKSAPQSAHPSKPAEPLGAAAAPSVPEPKTTENTKKKNIKLFIE